MQRIKSFSKALIIIMLLSQSTVQASWLTDFCNNIWNNYKPYIAVSCMALAAGLHAYFYYQPQPAKTQKDIKSDIKLSKKISNELKDIFDNPASIEQTDYGTFQVPFHSEQIFEMKLKGYRIFWTHAHKTALKSPQEFKKIVTNILYCATTYFKKRVLSMHLPRFNPDDIKPMLMNEQPSKGKNAFTNMSNMPEIMKSAAPKHAFALWILREHEREPFYGAIVTKDCWIKSLQ